MQGEEANHQHRITKIVWVIFLVSQISFLLAVFLTKKEIFNFGGESVLGEEPIIPIIFAIFALTNLLISFYLKFLSFKRAVDENNPKLFQTGTILALAFCESIGIMGLILAMLFHYHYFFLWFGLAIVGILLHYPRRQNLVQGCFPNINS